jgi:hypothetical protein
LWRVKSFISYYHRVKELVQRQEQIVSACKQGYSLVHTDSHFTVAELGHMRDVYAGIVKESISNLDQLLLVTTSFHTQMSDESRMAIIDKTAAAMDRSFRNVNQFNNQAALVSRQRSMEAGEIDLLKKMYGL